MQRCSLRSLYLRASCTWHFKLRGLRDKSSRAANQGNTFPPHTSLRGFFCYFHRCATCRLLNPTRFALGTADSCLTKRNSAPAGSRENRTALLERRANTRVYRNNAILEILWPWATAGNCVESQPNEEKRNETEKWGKHRKEVKKKEMTTTVTSNKTVRYTKRNINKRWKGWKHEANFKRALRNACHLSSSRTSFYLNKQRKGNGK